MAEAKKKTSAKVECTWPNVWTSEGKIAKGDKLELPKDEADALKKAGAVK